MKSRLFVVFSFCLAVGIVGYFVGLSVVRRMNRAVPVEQKLVEVVEPPEEELVDSSYSLGFARGRRAFWEQQGVSVPGRVVRYMGHEELDKEEEMRGYVDGYHRAGDVFQCTRGH